MVLHAPFALSEAFRFPYWTALRYTSVVPLCALVP